MRMLESEIQDSRVELNCKLGTSEEASKLKWEHKDKS